ASPPAGFPSGSCGSSLAMRAFARDHGRAPPGAGQASSEHAARICRRAADRLPAIGPRFRWRRNYLQSQIWMVCPLIVAVAFVFVFAVFSRAVCTQLTYDVQGEPGMRGGAGGPPHTQPLWFVHPVARTTVAVYVAA